MNARNELPDEFRELLDAYCSDSIDDDQVRRLEEHLLADEARRREFVAYFQLHTELQFAARARRAADSVLKAIDASTRRRALGRWGIRITVAATLLGMGIGAVLWPRRVREAPVAVKPQPKVGVATGLAMVIKLDGVQWEPSGQTPPLEGDLLAAGRLRFRSGRASLSMLTGVALLVEGPADVELISYDKVVCHKGKLRARVPEGAEGFIVSGPGSAIVDMGTEFGLNVDTDGRTRGKVFQGKVEAAVLNEAGVYRRSRVIGKETNAFEIDPLGGYIEENAGPEDFVTLTSQAVKPLVLDPAYREAILQSGPWSYWRFESLAKDVIPNEVAGGPSLKVTGPIRLSDPAQGNRSAVFDAGHPGQYIEMEGLWKPERRPGYAVELWFLPELIGHLALATITEDPPARPVNDPGKLHFKFLLELTSRTRMGLLHQPASVRLLHRFPPRYEGGDNLYSNRCYVPYRWHHLVGQLDGDRMELFLDGETTPPLSVDPRYTNQPGQLLIGRLTTILKPAANTKRTAEDTSRSFVGRLDEVALYDRPLTLEEIRQHYYLAPQAISAK